MFWKFYMIVIRCVNLFKKCVVDEQRWSSKLSLRLFRRKEKILQTRNIPNANEVVDLIVSDYDHTKEEKYSIVDGVLGAWGGYIICMFYVCHCFTL